MDDEALTVDRVEYVPASGPGESIAAGVATLSEPPDMSLVDEPTAAQPDLPLAGSPATEERPEQIIESLLFSSDTPLSTNRLAELVGCRSVEVRLHIAALNDKYVMAGLSFRIEHIARGHQMMTLPRYQPWLEQLNQQRSRSRLSGAALEALSIVAYKQPVIRADVEAIRGVACGEVLNRLRELGLIRIIGRAEVIGRPLLYGTTKKFLDIFGLADLDDLPPMEAITLRRRTAPVDDDAADQPLAASA